MAPDADLSADFLTMRQFTFTIPELTPSLNKLVKGRTHWSVYKKLQEDWFYLLKLATQDLKIPPAAKFERRKVEAWSHRVSLLDYENLVGGTKLLWDAMVTAGYLFDDGPKFLETGLIEQVMERKRRDERTVVRLTVFERNSIGGASLRTMIQIQESNLIFEEIKYEKSHV